MADSSFDIVSTVDRQEVDNALNQAEKELRTRFDFKNTGATIEEPALLQAVQKHGADESVMRPLVDRAEKNAAVVLAQHAAREEAAEVFDAHLVQAAALLLAQTAVEIEDEDESVDAHASVSSRFAHKVVFQVWGEDGELLVHSAHAPNSRLARRDSGFSNVRIDGERWRVYAAWNRGRDRLVQVGERIEAREDMAAALVGSLLKPLLWALPLLAVLLWIVIGRAMYIS